ncbi:MAG: hypothetical protein JSS82_09265 [Bacteroidetes bacterium]|nr:hypothetical protein [Bacteroidota bacterium]
MSINNIIDGMDGLQENQDGTLSNGYISITGGRYRMILTGGEPPQVPQNSDYTKCSTTSHLNPNCINYGCVNHGMACKDAHNKGAGGDKCVNMST